MFVVAALQLLKSDHCQHHHHRHHHHRHHRAYRYDNYMQQMTVYYVMFDELSAGTNDIHQEKKQKLHRNAIIMHAAFVKKVKTKKTHEVFT